jgi:hypothetical protein
VLSVRIEKDFQFSSSFALRAEAEFWDIENIAAPATQIPHQSG